MRPRNSFSMSETEDGSGDRGIQWTLDALLGILLLFTVLTASVSSISSGDRSIQQGVAQQQLSQDGTDILAAANARGDLKEAALYWDEAECRFIGAQNDEPSDVFYTSLSDTSNPLEPVFSELVENEQLSYNLEIVYRSPSSGLESQSVVKQGAPGEVSTTVTETVILKDTDTIDSGTELKNLGTCPNTPGYFAPDNGQNSPRFNVMKFRLTLWQA